MTSEGTAHGRFGQPLVLATQRQVQDFTRIGLAV
jgi:hypothetical protein